MWLKWEVGEFPGAPAVSCLSFHGGVLASLVARVRLHRDDVIDSRFLRGLCCVLIVTVFTDVVPVLDGDGIDDAARLTCPITSLTVRFQPVSLTCKCLSLARWLEYPYSCCNRAQVSLVPRSRVSIAASFCLTVGAANPYGP